MVKACAVVGCTNRSNREQGISFFSIPAVIHHQCQKTLELSARRRSQWLAKIGRKDLTDKDVTPNTRVCSQHFHTGKPSALFDETNCDWVPSIKMRPGPLQPACNADLQRFQRHQKRQKELQRDAHCDENVPEHNDVILKGSDAEEELIQKLQTVTLERDNLRVERDALRNRLQNLEEENRRLRKRFNMDEESLKNDDEKVHFYTGLPTFTLLMHVFQLCAEYIPSSHRNAITRFEEFMLVMMRLRLNLLMEDLAYRFGISQPTVSRIITRWLDVMSLRLESLLVWPEREVLQKTMPECFKKAFGTSVAVIIDCFEVFIERPSGLLAKAGTWSDYKHHNTVKFLIGITPQGTVCFLSMAYVGRTSDTYITEHCGLLDKLTPGDVVLSDRGFNIGGSAGVLKARVVQPAFVHGRPQLAGEEVDATRKIAHVRVHVERVIGLVRRKFHILHQVMPIDSLKIKDGSAFAPVDQIATICCALCNLCPPIIPMFENEEAD